MDKSLPADINAERATLGSILLDRDAIIPVAPWLFPEYFYMEKHAAVYEAQLACYNRRTPPDLVNVTDELRRQNRLDGIGGVAYLLDLANSVPTAVHVEYYGRIVERTALLRRLIVAGGKIAALGYDETNELEETLDKAESELFAVSQRRANEGFVHIGQVVDSFFDQITQMQERGGEVVGLKTGFHDFDKLTGGLQKSDLLILAARPATGKTSLALNIAYQAALHEEANVAIFSLEMSRDQLMQRILATHTGVDMQKLRTGQIRDSELQQLTEALGTLSSLPIYIDDSPGASSMDVRSKCRRLQAEAGIDLIIIDYLQLMQGGGKRDGNRVQEISEISRGLKALAREVNVPVIALSQLSRAVESRTSHVPMLSDLRESGCLAGDTLIFMPRDGSYRRIDSFIGNHDTEVLAINTETWKLEPRRVTNAFCTGMKPVFRLKTRLGRTIRATANHKFLTIDGWQRLDELAIGQHLALPRFLPTASQQTLSDAQLGLLAHMIGDGCTLARQPIHYTTADEDIADIVTQLAKEVFGDAIQPRINRERNWYHVYLSASDHLTHGVRNPLARWFDELDIFDLRSHEKRVPAVVFEQPAEAIGCFLRHLWATDGCIWISSDTIKYAPRIYYATSSSPLAYDVQSLLLRLGINAIIRTVSQGEKGRDQYHVDVTGKPDMQQFIKLVRAIGRRKIEAIRLLDKIIQSKQTNTNRDIIPHSIWRSYAVPAMQNIGMTSREMQAGIGISYCGTGLYKQNVGRERLEKLANVVQSQTLISLSQSDVYWDEIIAIIPDGEELVYDLTIDGLSNFIANNIILHNSIEQDADIVLFIYREELYDPDTDKKGIAEIHLAKHRNGPTGVVPLRFERSTTRFTNLETYRQPEGY